MSDNVSLSHTFGNQGSSKQNIFITYTYTYVDNDVDPSTMTNSGVLIKYNGSVWKSGSGGNQWIFQGGYMGDSATRSAYDDVDTFLTDSQKVTLRSMIAGAVKRGQVFFTSDNIYLYECAQRTLFTLTDSIVNEQK